MSSRWTLTFMSRSTKRGTSIIFRYDVDVGRPTHTLGELGNALLTASRTKSTSDCHATVLVAMAIPSYASVTDSADMMDFRPLCRVLLTNVNSLFESKAGAFFSGNETRICFRNGPAAVKVGGTRRFELFPDDDVAAC